MNRRVLLGAGTAFAAVPWLARADASRVSLTGTMEQGALVVGRALSGTKAAIDGADLHVSADGAFAFGLAYDRTKSARLELRYSDGSTEVRDVAPIVRQYDIQRINGLPQKFVTPPPEDEERIKREHVLIAAARKRDSDGMGFAQAFEWPAAGIISGVFGSQRILNGTPMTPHFGVDIAAPIGTPIHAPAPGIVMLSDEYDLEGGFTLLDHGHGVSTCYLHQSKRLVKEGDTVEAGQPLGLIGMTGRATGPHLHWGMNWFQVKLDPSRSTRTPAPAKA